MISLSLAEIASIVGGQQHDIPDPEARVTGPVVFDSRAAALSLLLAIPASAASYTPGAPGAGDTYYPESGNGGYDVSHYDLRLKYQPKTDLLEGTATLLATTTQDLSRFNLDFGLKVSEIRVNGKKASFATSGKHELEVTPAAPLPKGKQISVVVRYAGKPSELKIDGASNWHRTPDGGVIAQEPDAAVWWFPSNDHPTRQPQAAGGDPGPYAASTGPPGPAGTRHHRPAPAHRRAARTGPAPRVFRAP